MNKIIKYLTFLTIFTLFVSCSFDSKTGIWSGSEKEKKKASKLEKDQENAAQIIKVYSSGDVYNLAKYLLSLQ